ncbi:hypothetical protein ACSNOI_45740, partial [Actinomadura kijaniata]|uniref:hypothetical protein n=1 Tax=Actinomadura kijaniata TaxID=46161 RepID=UPI003F1A8E95
PAPAPASGSGRLSELGRVLRLDARRTALLVAVPVLAALGAVTAWLSLVPGVGYWDNSVVALGDAVRMLGPVAAALAAWAALRERRLDHVRDLSPRSPATGALHDLLLLSGAALVAHAGVTVVIVAETLSRYEAGRPHPLGPLAGAAALVLHVVAGYLAGRVAPRVATPVAVGLAAAAWAFLRTPGGSWVGLLPPAVFGRVGLFTQLRTGVLADQVVWAAGLTAVLVLGYVAWVTRRTLPLLPLAVAVGLVVVATFRLESAGGRAVAAVPVEHVCREWPLTVCVHPALRAALPSLTTAVTPLATRLTGTPGGFARVEQRPPTEPARVAGGVAVVHLGDELTPGYEARAVRQIRDGLVVAGTCPAPAAGYRALVDAWLVGEAPPALPDARAVRRFGAWNEDRRRAWLRAHFAAYRTCSLRAADFRPGRSRVRAPGTKRAAPVRTRPDDR